MKITKVKTKRGEPGTPVTTELDTIVERMRADDTKEKAARIAATSLRSRIAMEQGAPRLRLGDCDRLPYLLFTATFSKRELSKHLKARDVPNLTNLGKTLKALRWPRGGNTGVRGYYLRLLKESPDKS